MPDPAPLPRFGTASWGPSDVLSPHPRRRGVFVDGDAAVVSIARRASCGGGRSATRRTRALWSTRDMYPCRRRVGCLYAPWITEPFWCRRCHHLLYDSQFAVRGHDISLMNASMRWDRARLRAERRRGMKDIPPPRAWPRGVQAANTAAGTQLVTCSRGVGGGRRAVRTRPRAPAPAG